MLDTYSLPVLAIIAGLLCLLWSADKFVGSAALVARQLKVPAVLIGMVIVGFGTSMPEMVISGVASINGNPSLALGNAYGSNIANIALILGLTAVIMPIRVESGIVRKEIPLLIIVTIISVVQIMDGTLSRIDALVLIAVFLVVIGWSILQGFRYRKDSLAQDIKDELDVREQPVSLALVWLIIGLLVLVISSQVFVWGSVSLAKAFGVSDLIVGLTVVALGTSLPELVSSIMAIKKGEHDLALGNVLGSNLFNTLAVVGIAGIVKPFEVSNDVLYRDLPVMLSLTLTLYLTCYQFRQAPYINRWEGSVLLCAYLGYMGYLLFQSV